MPTDATPGSEGSPSPGDALTTAIAELSAEQAPATGEPAERYWLRVGIGLGLRQPGRAALLLSGLESDAAPSSGVRSGTTTTSSARLADPSEAVEKAAEEITPGRAPEPAAEAESMPADPDEVPVRSWLLARSSGLSVDADPETVFGWVEQLSPTDIRRLGNAVTSQLAAGASRDLERGFGLAWSAGTRLPRADLRALFGRFSELELAVCSALGGRDLMSASKPPENSVGVLLSIFVRRSNPAVTEATAILEREGEPGRRALVAIWNAWIAMRYRDLIAPPLFKQLVHAWVSVVGRLPEA